MKPRNLSAVIGGKRYCTEGATLLASGPYPREGRGKLGAAPESLLEIRLGGVELGALVMRGAWDVLGQHTFLFQTPKGNFFAQHQSSLSGEHDRIVPLDQGEALSLYERLAKKEVPFDQAFPGVDIEDA
jgi:hypothetical protein